MVITRTPLRVSLFGGGSDYPEAVSRLPDGGRTVGCSIDKFTYVTVNRASPLQDYRYRLSYARIEFANHWDDIEHPSVRECLRFLDFTDPVEIYVITDLPSRTGLGSSSSFTVCLLHALYAMRGQLVSSERLAREAIHVERDMIHERVGLQDQYLCALGGFRRLQFSADGSVDSSALPLARERLTQLSSHLLLLYTGMRRTAHEVVEGQLQRTSRGELDTTLERMVELVNPACELLCSNSDLDQLGHMLHQSWEWKRGLSAQVSNSAIDQAYARARAAGCLGGKLLGAGAGGFLLLYVRPDQRADVLAALHPLIPVSFDWCSSGSQLFFTSHDSC